MTPPTATKARQLTKAQRATKREELHRLLLAAALLTQELVLDDLKRLAHDQEAPELRELTLASHRLQLVLRTVDGGHQS